MTRTVRGTWRSDGTFIGFDYGNQHWYDTAESAKRDPAFPQGSANNPIAFISASDDIIPD